MAGLKKSVKKKLVISFFGVFFVILILGVLISFFLKDFFNFKSSYVPKNIINVDRDFNFQIFFNDDLSGTPFTEKILEEINNAKKEIDIAVYSIDSVTIKDALYNAAERGVKVDLVYDYKKSEQHKELFNTVSPNINIFEIRAGNSSDSSMHNKFAIFDNTTLISGSFNWTKLQEKIDPTYILITDDDAIVSSYNDEFLRLKNGQYGKKKFFNADYKPFNKKINFINSYVDIWFSPGVENFSIKNEIINLIESAEKDIKIMIWHFTDNEIMNALLKKAREGIMVQIITDDNNIFLDDSVFPLMISKINEQSLENIYIVDDSKRNEILKNNFGDDYSNLNSFLHHHTLIIDNKTVLFGTNNWSNNGAFENDENILISNNELLVESFLNSFYVNLNILIR